MRKQNANGYIVYASHVGEAEEKLHCLEVSSNERPGMSPSCQDKKRRAWVLALLPSCLYPKGLQSESLYWGGSLSLLFSLQSHSLQGQKWLPSSRDQAALWWPCPPFQTYQLPKGLCLSVLWEEISLLKRNGIVIVKSIPIKMFNCKGGKTICKSNESPCLQHRRVRNDLR